MQKINLKQRLEKFPTPFYYYDLDLLRETLNHLNRESKRFNYHIHYALKANADQYVLKIIKEAGLGADCVSGNEVQMAVNTGFGSSQIFFAGVGKTDEEMITGLNAGIGCFNCESIQELIVLNQLARERRMKARIALRINPNVDAHTHAYITTGIQDNKFGIYQHFLDEVVQLLPKLKNLELVGLHFHIGSQIVEMEPFIQLCQIFNELNHWFMEKGFVIGLVNLGGGLGIDYTDPDKNSISDFKSFFETIAKHLKPLVNQEVHFELGRSIVGQMGSLVSKVLFIKKGISRDFVILDAGMTELIRPALYQSSHLITNLSKTGQKKGAQHRYDIVGPICETTDFLGRDVIFPETERNDLIIIRSVGAYGQVMAFNYNLRRQAGVVYSDDLK